MEVYINYWYMLHSIVQIIILFHVDIHVHEVLTTLNMALPDKLMLTKMIEMMCIAITALLVS